MRQSLLTIGLLLTCANAQAADIPTVDIRPVQTDSVDVFAVLQHIQAGDAALIARDFVSAQNHFQTVILHDPAQPRARTGLRHALMGRADWAAAAEFIDDPLSADGYLITVMRGATEHALNYLTEAVTQHPNDPRLWNALGHAQDASEKFTSARQSYAMAEMAGQRAGLADNNIGQSHLREGEMDAALDAFIRAVAAAPNDIRFDNNRRLALLGLGQTSLAIAGLESSRATVFLTQAGDKAASSGEPRLARTLWTSAQKLSPRHEPALAARLAKH